jgi:TnpA family transposase
MPTRELLSPAQRQQFVDLPDSLDERALVRHYTLSAEDLAHVDQKRGAHNRLGFCVQLCLLRFPGRALAPGERVPKGMLRHIAAQVGVEPEAFEAYAERENTRREHLAEIERLFGYQPFSEAAQRELAEWLLPTALGTGSGVALVTALVEELRERKIVMPALSTVERLGWEVRRRAQSLVFERLTAGLTPEQRGRLDRLLEVEEDARHTAVVWLRQPPGAPSPGNLLRMVEKLEFIRGLGLPTEVGRLVHQNRLLQLAREGAKTKPQHLARFDPERRYATLVAFLTEAAQTLTDEAIEMHDRLIGSLLGAGERARDSRFQANGKAINEKVRLYARVGQALITARESRTDPYEALEGVIPWDGYVRSVEEADALSQPGDFDYLDLIASRYGWIRRYAPKLVEAFEFKAAPPSLPLLAAIQLLRELNESGKRKVPEDAPASFVKPRWSGHVFTSEGIDRHYYELCALTELRNSLRSGDIWVSGSRRYQDFEDYLLPREAWGELHRDGMPPVAVDSDFAAYISRRAELLHEGLSTVGRLISEDTLPDVRLKGGDLKITPLAKAVPDGVDEVTRCTYSLLPRIKLTDLLVEVDSWTGFSRHFTHLRSGASPKDREVLYAAILADGINLGLTKMADACPGMTFERLAWVSDWHVRDETYQRALAEVINAHHRLPFSALWGDGTTSSSDGQRYQAGGHRSTTEQVNARYGREPGVTFYTHVSDQYGPFHTKVINATVRDATHVLDGLLYHETDLDIQEHYSDTQGYTDQVFAMTHLLGFRFAPRIRDLSDKKLYTIRKPGCYPALAPLIGGAIKTKQVASHWDEILRLASSIKLGTVTASLILRKLASYPRQNGLAWALRELGRIEKTLFTLEWLQDPELRRRVNVGLNKGEARNALAKAVFFNRLGEVRDRSYEDQRYRASGLNLVVAAIILWNTAYLERAVGELRRQGLEIADDALQHLSPLGWEHIALTGEYRWQLKETSSLQTLRPLRVLKV